jgi:hypothetical protein
MKPIVYLFLLAVLVRFIYLTSLIFLVVLASLPIFGLTGHFDMREVSCDNPGFITLVIGSFLFVPLHRLQRIVEQKFREEKLRVKPGAE